MCRRPCLNLKRTRARPIAEDQTIRSQRNRIHGSDQMLEVPRATTMASSHSTRRQGGASKLPQDGCSSLISSRGFPLKLHGQHILTRARRHQVDIAMSQSGISNKAHPPRRSSPTPLWENLRATEANNFDEERCCGGALNFTIASIYNIYTHSEYIYI